MASKERELLIAAVERMHELKYVWVDERDSVDRMLLELIADINKVKELLAQPEQEPVAWFYDYDGTTWVKLKKPDLPNMHHSVTNVTPLYTSPPKQEPLSDEEAHILCQNRTLIGGTTLDLLRDVEKAHGITGGQE